MRKMRLTIESAERVREQSGVIPYAHDKQGNLFILLISSRHAGNWSIPKGKKEDELGKKGSAHQEAWEEAGVEGKIRYRLGAYEYRKGFTEVMQKVTVYGLEVLDMSKKFPEKNIRMRKWFPLEQARKKIGNKLRPFLTQLEKELGR